jgi:hypothetical protein
MKLDKNTNKRLAKLLGLKDGKIHKQISELETQVLFELKKALDGVRLEIGKMYEKYGDDVTYSEMSKFNRLNNQRLVIKEHIEEMTGSAVHELRGGLKKIFVESYAATGVAINEALKTQIDFASMNIDVIRDAVNNPLSKVKWRGSFGEAASNAIGEISSEITQGLTRGRGYSKTARNIKERFDKLGNNVQRIVRTESHRVQVTGSDLSLNDAVRYSKKIGIPMVKVISSVLDSRTRDQSAQMDGQMAGSDGLFRYPNGVRGLPGNTGVAAYDINDREVVIIQIKEDYLKKYQD